MEKDEKMRNGVGVADQKVENEKVKKEVVDSGALSTAQLNENWKEYLTNHPFNYKGACVKGEIFDKINSYQGKMYCFPIKYGCNIEDGNIVMLNQYCEAFAIEDRCSISYEEWIMSEIIGTAELLIYMSNGQGIVFVKDFSVFEFANSSDPEFAVTHDDICKACYLEDPDTVCMDDLQPFAGQIMGIEGDTVYVFVSLNIKDRKKWIWDPEAFTEDPHKNI
ncbi:MAG: hypothetical protein K2G55_01280 [Lachnospiraceae bacterium]|nr:hypothetical protein [Lachnospiraceae bacterium]MDE7205310.1 hypothetical protein [Lachnospiraceae bacterium]